jgi:transposase
MPAKRIAMRQVRDVLRLKAAGVSGNEIARRVGVASSTVRLTLKRLAAAGLGWPLPAEMTDAALEAQLFTTVGKKQGHRRRAEPDWAAVHRELKRKHVTLQILWDEYIERHPDGYRYSRFCELSRGWASRISVTMRQTHAGGDKLFVDYAGDAVPVIVDRLTGKTRPVLIFVAVLGASNFTYGEASWTQALADWIGAHTRAFEAIGGVPNLLVPDNTKVAVIKACLYEPQVNRTYAEMAAHYDTAVLPARPRRPRDNAKVEAAVLIIERWLLGRLRHRRFYSLAELNAAIAECCANSTRSGRSGGSASPAAPCSRNSIGHTSSPCPASPMPLPNGGCAGSASIIMSRSRRISTASPTASPAARSRCG